MNPNTRSDDELNRIIAEWCGWKWTKHSAGTRLQDPSGFIVNEHYAEEWRLPNYCQDLNACHEAEKRLDYIHQHKYAEYLFEIVGGYEDYYDGIMFSEAMKLTFATARQRAEALVRVIEQQKGQNDN